MNDLQFAFRQLLKNPGFTAVAVLSLSLGIAANTTIFSFVNALLLRPPPVEAPSELWQVWRQRLKGGPALERYQGLSFPGYTHFRDHGQSFVSLAAFDPETPFVSWNRDGIGQSVQCQFVSGDFFSVCRVNATLGRTFGSEEDRHPGAAPVAVVSHAFWKSSLGSDPQILGRTLTLNGVALTIVGVAPAGFTGLMAGLSPDLWAPFMMASPVLHDPQWHTRTGAFSLFGVGRLKPGLSRAQAEAEFTILTRQLEEIDPGHYKDFAAAVFPTTMIPAPFRGFVGGFTAILMGAVFMVLLIACANAANLMLARAIARRREMAVRASIGASRFRLMRQLLTESVLLALLGGGIGLLLTKWFVPVVMRLTPPTLPIRPDVGFDARVFLFTGLVSLLTGIIFGFVGRRLSQGKPEAGEIYEIVGVVETGKYRTLGENPTPVVFRCRLQERGPRSTFVAHVRGNSQGVMTAIRGLVQELDPRLSLSRLGTLEQHLALALFPARTTGLLFTVFGAVAMLLAVSGLFGVIAYSVSQRTREIGVRMALGAKHNDVLTLVLRQGMKLAGVGILIGLAGAFALTRLMGSLLYGIGATDPLTFAVIPLSLAAVAFLACYVPARRAARVDPMEALRCE